MRAGRQHTCVWRLAAKGRQTNRRQTVLAVLYYIYYSDSVLPCAYNQPVMLEDALCSRPTRSKPTKTNMHWVETPGAGAKKSQICLVKPLVVVVVVNSHIQRFVLATEETSVTQVSHRPIECQSLSWSQRGAKVNGSHRRYFQHAHFISIVGVGKRGVYQLVHGELSR